MKSIVAYHRPARLDEAISLLERPDVTTTVIAGGTAVTAAKLPEQTEVVDVQDVIPTGVESRDDRVVYGAMTRLTEVIADPLTPPLVAELARREGPNTLRNASTIGGTVAEGDGESELIAGLLVHDAQVTITGLSDPVPLPALLDDWSLLDRAIITSISIDPSGLTASARTGRTPADTSIVAVAGRVVTGGIRLALTGVGPTPILTTPEDLDSLEPPADFRGSSEYRRELAAVLTKRVVHQLGGAS